MGNIEEEEFRILTDNVKRILSYLENDEATGRKGIFHDVSDLKNRVTSIEDRHKIQIGIMAFFSVIGAVILWAVTIATGLFKQS